MIKDTGVGTLPQHSPMASFEAPSFIPTTISKAFSFLIWLLVCCIPVGVLCAPVSAEDGSKENTSQRHTIPILGVTFDQEWEPVGMVAEVLVRFEQRNDSHGLRVHFDTSPGRFSPLAKDSVLQAIVHAAKASHLAAESWTVTLTLPYPGVTMYGESLSGMVALSVLAFARGDPLPPDRVMTGTIASDGHIGIVGGIPLKIQAAHKKKLRRVLIPEELDVADGDWRTPFLMEISPVGNVQKAYLALTGQPLEQPLAVHTSGTMFRR